MLNSNSCLPEISGVFGVVLFCFHRIVFVSLIFLVIFIPGVSLNPIVLRFGHLLCDVPSAQSTWWSCSTGKVGQMPPPPVTNPSCRPVGLVHRGLRVGRFAYLVHFFPFLPFLSSWLAGELALIPSLIRKMFRRCQFLSVWSRRVLPHA